MWILNIKVELPEAEARNPQSDDGTPDDIDEIPYAFHEFADASSRVPQDLSDSPRDGPDRHKE